MGGDHSIRQLRFGKTSKEEVYRTLKDRIVSCELLPGSVIAEEKLCEEFGVSRTPVRESLLRLEREHLVEIYPRKGTFVSQISLHDIYEIFQIRLIIEPRVAKMVCRSLDASRLADYLRRFREVANCRDGSSAWFDLDRSFHSYLIESSQNRRLVDLYSGIMDQNFRVRILAGRLPSRIDEMIREHEDIIEALLDMDESRIEEAMVAHVVASREASLRLERYIQE